MNDSFWVEMMGAEVRYIEGRWRTRAIVAGDGKPLLLLHGTGGHAENFIRNIAAYARHFRVYAIDMLWHGYSDTGDFDPEVLPRLIEHILDVAQAAGIERMHVEGQSMGGWVAALLALRHPALIDRLVLTTPMGYAPDPGTVDYVEQDIVKLRNSNIAVLENPTLEAVRERMVRIVNDPKCLTEEAVRVRHKIYNLPAVNAVQRRLMTHYLGGPEPRRHQLTDTLLKTVRHRTLLCWADHNPLPLQVGEHMARQIPGARFHCHRNCGHWAQFESFDEHNRIVLEFLTAPATS